MHVEQIYTSCLSQASYYIESNGEVAVIDPIRDYDVYVEKAKSRGARIKYIFETHFHADFLSGHLDLANATNATIVYGPNAVCGFDCVVAADNDIFNLGQTTIKVIHTPGHTPESSSFLLYDENGQPQSIFTGDTLFVGDVGRPDLCQAGATLTMDDMASMLYDTINNKIKPLDDALVVYPGHGPGSACGKNLGPETTTTIGRERVHNYALQPMDKAAFIKAVTDGIQLPPAYFFEEAGLNKNGYKLMDEIMDEAKGLGADQVEIEQQNGTLIIDSRIPDVFENGFIPKAINIGLNGQYAIWAASLFELDRRIVIVSEHGQEKESIVRLTRVGFSNICGYLQGGFQTWLNAGKDFDMVVSITAEEFALDNQYSSAQVLDVRKSSEWDAGIVHNAQLKSLDSLQQHLEELDSETDYEVHCAGGYRSMIACSILKSNGYHRVKNVLGGYNKIKETDIKIEIPKLAIS